MWDEVPEDALSALRALRAAQRQQREAEARRFTTLCTYADACSAAADPAKLVSVGSEGTPPIAEFADLELGAALGIDSSQAAELLGAALDVRHRLPFAWEALTQLRLRPWLAERLAGITRELDRGAARRVDAQLSPGYGHWSPRRLLDAAEGMVLQELEPAAAQARQDAARELRRVDFHPGPESTRLVDAVLDGVDALALEQQVGRLAGVLAEGGCADTLPVRRAKALGILSDPQRALALLEPALTVDSAPGGAHGRTVVDLTVHVTEQNLRTGAGVARSNRLGPLTVETLRNSLQGCEVRVHPVLRVESAAPADAYEVPAWMREAVTLRNPTSVFPFSAKRSRLDLDHTIPYVPGAAGQTRPDNLGPLARREHRAKTYGGWRVTQPLAGVFLWRSPLGYVYAVTQSGTWELHDPGAVPREGRAGSRMEPAREAARAGSPPGSRAHRGVAAANRTGPPSVAPTPGALVTSEDPPPF